MRKDSVTCISSFNSFVIWNEWFRGKFVLFVILIHKCYKPFHQSRSKDK